MGNIASELTFENVWNKDVPEIRRQAIAIWRQSAAIDRTSLQDRAQQIVYVAKNQKGQVVAISTAYKGFVKQLGQFFYLYRCLAVKEYSIPGIDSKITLLTRDFLESIHKQDTTNQAIGLMAIVQNTHLKQRTMAVWPSGLVYIGNTGQGDHIRVYYFRHAEISLKHAPDSGRKN